MVCIIYGFVCGVVTFILYHIMGINAGACISVFFVDLVIYFWYEIIPIIKSRINNMPKD